MNSKLFEYSTKDRPFLKQDIRMRITFLSLFVLTFAWQFISIIVAGVKETLTNTQLFVGIFSCLIMLLFGLICLMYLNKSTTTVRKIKKDGKAVSSVMLLMKTDKKSFVWFYNILSKVLAVIMAMVAICAVTYLILEIIYYTTYSFYMPILFFITICGFNSVYHIQYEIKTMKDVEKHNNAY